MNTSIIAVIVFVALFAVFMYFRQRNRRLTHPDYLNTSQFDENKFTLTLTTPQGRTIYAQRPLDSRMLTCADLAFNLRRPAMDVNGYEGVSNPHTPENGFIAVLPSIRDYNSNGEYSPAFAVYINEMDYFYNSVYDQKRNEKPSLWQKIIGDRNTHYILAAEQILNAQLNAFAVAEYKSDWTQCRNAIFHGEEHSLLSIIDPVRYAERQGANDYHPILNCVEYNTPVNL